jgi:hypothetical protein
VKNHIYERRMLQFAVFVAAWIPIAAGLAGVLDGPRMLHGASAGAPDLESHFRYLSGLLLGIGIAYMATIRSIERHSSLFLALSGVVIVGGLSRLAFAVGHGGQTLSHQLALVMELVVVPALLLWQRRIAAIAGRQD